MNGVSHISFPGLGIKEFALDRVFISHGDFCIYWYGIIICLGIAAGFAIGFLRMRKLGVTADDIADFVIICVPTAIVGARLYYVLAESESYKTFYDVIAIWNGGLAIYGGVIFGIAAFVAVCRRKKKPILKMCDAATPGLLTGQIIGRWGNFFNAEAFGSSEVYEFLGKKIDISVFSESNPLRMTINGETVHPTFLYESLWNLAGFVLINIFFKKRAFDGEVLVWYITWYGLGRCVIEGLRTDSLVVGNIRISQLLALCCFVFGIIITVMIRIKKKKMKGQCENGSNN